VTGGSPAVDEADLVNAAMAGDERAFAELTARHHRSVRAFTRRVTGSAADGDDIAQSAFLAAWRRRSTYAGGSFRAWVCAIAWRIHCRARPSRVSGVEPEIHHDDWTAERLDLRRALLALRAEERAAVSLCYGEGMSHAEASLVLGVPLGTLKSWVLRGRERLQALLSAYAAVKEETDASTDN
jgi:RNA polymerase sigma-70 factor (ECF subfamily)